MMVRGALIIAAMVLVGWLLLYYWRGGRMR